MKKEFRVIFCPAIGSDVAFEKECGTFENAELVFDAVADYTLLLHDKNLMSDYSNMGSIQKFVADEWMDLDRESYKRMES